MLLKEINRTASVSAEAKSGEFTYNVGYTIENGIIRSLNCDVKQTVQESVEVPGGEMQTVEREEHLGYLLNESGNIQISLRENVDIAPHLTMFNAILKKVKG